MTTFRFPITITSVFERRVQKHLGGAGKDATFSTDSAGWYIRLNDHVALHVGAERPELNGEYELVIQPRSRK